jgi:hypothetical protein
MTDAPHDVAGLAERLRSHVNDRGGPAMDEDGHPVGSVWPMMLEAAARLESLSQALREAETDAERYRFLRSRDLDTIHKGGVFAGMTPENFILNEEDLDREVDAARAFIAGNGGKDE